MALDISQATNAAKSKTIVQACLNDNEFKDCDVIVITAGIARKPGMSRDDLLLVNAQVMREVVADIVKYAPKAIKLASKLTKYTINIKTLADINKQINS